MHPATVAAALFDVLGEFPTTESVCALNPGARAFEQMIQVTIPAHLRQRMHMGPGADGSILIDGRNHRVYPLTEIRQQGRHRASDDTREARLLGDALRSNPDAYASTVFSQVATMSLCADEFERARSVPVMIPLGRVHMEHHPPRQWLHSSCIHHANLGYPLGVGSVARVGGWRTQCLDRGNTRRRKRSSQSSTGSDNRNRRRRSNANA